MTQTVDELKNSLKLLNKSDLKKIIKFAKNQMNSSIDIGDKVTFTVDYMIGDADGDTSESTVVKIKTQDDKLALDVISHILTTHTKPNSGHWGFSLDEESFSKKPDDVYNILYDPEKAPAVYEGITLTPGILDRISQIVEDCFRGEAEYSFLVYQDFSITQ